MDPIILLTPLFVAAIVLLLGFAGCHEVFGSDPPLLPFLTLRVRVPMTLGVREIVFLWDPPNTSSGSKTLVKPTPSGIEGEENLFDHELTGQTDDGSWTTHCRVVVQGGTAQGDEGVGTFSLPVEDSTNPTATFQASATGGPTTLDVVFMGVA